MNVLQNKTLRRVPWLTDAQRKEIRELLQGKRKTRDYTSVQEWKAQCFHPLPYADRLMCALNEICGTHGVEAIWGRNPDGPDYEYLNAGETYAATILLDRQRGRVFVSSWGDVREHNDEKRTGGNDGRQSSV